MTPFLLWHLLRNSARRNPAQVALVDGEHHLTYGELEAQSNQLAHTLQEQGIGVGSRVGLYLDKSSAAIVSIFGILKAGAAYVPLDPASPVPRVALIAEDCQLVAIVGNAARLAALLPCLPVPPPHLIVTEGSAAGLRQSTQSQLIEWEVVRGASVAALAESVAIENDLAYILYTSGSTGRPKGVMIDHRAALTFINWAAGYFQLKPADRLSNHAPLHFDLSIFDLFAGIAVGATIALVPPLVTLFPYTLAAWMAEKRITTWYSVPSALIQLLLHGELPQHDLSALRLVLFAGEVFPIQHLRWLQQLLPTPSYYNLYGPTESNVCTVFPVPTLSPAQSTPCPIGRACANTQVMALNERGELVAPGEEGELYVRGPTLMRGYWGLPDATAARLLPNPLAPDSGERVYRTGDLVRLDFDGNYLFIGRRDGMVKSRGYRIELGEIEAALHRHPGVAEVAVIPLPDDNVGCRLVAYVVPRSGSIATQDGLRATCQRYLPHYMIPEQVEILSYLPRTSTGKIDRIELGAKG